MGFAVGGVGRGSKISSFKGNFVYYSDDSRDLCTTCQVTFGGGGNCTNNSRSTIFSDYFRDF